MMDLTGQCLCGDVCFTLAAAPDSIALCHCKMCRRWCGGLPLAVVDAKVSLESADTLSWWKSSEWGERGFCCKCGSSLFWRAIDGDDAWEVSVASLNDERDLQIKEHIYIDDKADFYDFADDAPRLSGAAFTARVFTELAAERGEIFISDAFVKLERQNGSAFAAEVRRLMQTA